MALPQIEYATYQLTLPSSKKTIKYRPFNVKEEKILMMAMESGGEGDMIQAVIQIIENCTLGNIKDVDSLPYFDIEYIFIQLRKKSIGEIITASKKCSNKECHLDIPIEINLDEVTVDTSKTPSNIIPITDTIGIEMKYPSINELDEVGDSKVDRAFNTIADMISSIYDGDKVHKSSDIDRKELQAWIEDLPDSTFKQIKEYMSDMPKTVYNSTVTCPNCGEVNEIHLEGLSSFFG